MQEKHRKMQQNSTAREIFKDMVLAAAALFVNGFGVYLTIHAGIGAGPWDVFNLGLSGTFGILYGTASIIVAFSVLAIDIVPVPAHLPGAVLMILIGLTVMGYTQYYYMQAAFHSVHFNATKIRHQRIHESILVLKKKIK